MRNRTGQMQLADINPYEVSTGDPRSPLRSMLQSMEDAPYNRFMSGLADLPARPTRSAEQIAMDEQQAMRDRIMKEEIAARDGGRYNPWNYDPNTPSGSSSSYVNLSQEYMPSNEYYSNIVGSVSTSVAEKFGDKYTTTLFGAGTTPTRRVDVSRTFHPHFGISRAFIGELYGHGMDRAASAAEAQTGIDLTAPQYKTKSNNIGTGRSE